MSFCGFWGKKPKSPKDPQNVKKLPLIIAPYLSYTILYLACCIPATLGFILILKYVMSSYFCYKTLAYATFSA
jgi:hypothetical protein